MYNTYMDKTANKYMLTINRQFTIYLTDAEIEGKSIEQLEELAEQKALNICKEELMQNDNSNWNVEHHSNNDY